MDIGVGINHLVDSLQQPCSKVLTKLGLIGMFFVEDTIAYFVELEKAT